MVQRLRIRLAMQEMHIQSLVGELRSHMLQNSQAQVPKLEKHGLHLKDPE